VAVITVLCSNEQSLFGRWRNIFCLHLSVFFKQITHSSFAQFVTYFLRVCGWKAQSCNTVTVVLKLKWRFSYWKAAGRSLGSISEMMQLNLMRFLGYQAVLETRTNTLLSFVNCFWTLLHICAKFRWLIARIEWRTHILPLVMFVAGLIRRRHCLIQKLSSSVDLFISSALPVPHYSPFRCKTLS